MRKTLALTSAVMLFVASSAQAVVFFTDGFDYSDGDLETVSSSAWVPHSGNPPGIQVTSGRAIVLSPGDQDSSRLTGSVMGVNDTWYYATTFSFNGDGNAINEDYFIHFKDDTIFGFNARLLPIAPVASGDFSLAIAASSLGDGQADWASDFTFGEEITAVVEWDNNTGQATLWINPTDSNSPNITDDEPEDGQRLIESLALRQDGGGNGNTTSIDIVSVGTTFDEVLAAVGGGAGADVDLDDDGDVDGADFLAIQRTNPSLIPDWQSQFGSGALSVVTTAVPEPSSVMLIGLAMALIPLARRQRA